MLPATFRSSTLTAGIRNPSTTIVTTTLAGPERAAGGDCGVIIGSLLIARVPAAATLTCAIVSTAINTPPTIGMTDLDDGCGRTDSTTGWENRTMPSISDLRYAERMSGMHGRTGTFVATLVRPDHVRGRLNTIAGHRKTRATDRHGPRNNVGRQPRKTNIGHRRTPAADQTRATEEHRSTRATEKHGSTRATEKRGSTRINTGALKNTDQHGIDAAGKRQGRAGRNLC